MAVSKSVSLSSMYSCIKINKKSSNAFCAKMQILINVNDATESYNSLFVKSAILWNNRIQIH